MTIVFSTVALITSTPPHLAGFVDDKLCPFVVVFEFRYFRDSTDWAPSFGLFYPPRLCYHYESYRQAFITTMGLLSPYTVHYVYSTHRIGHQTFHSVYPFF